jgi:hypothetical protein
MVNRRKTLAALAAGTASALGAPAFAAPSKDEKRAEVRKMAQETLARCEEVVTGRNSSAPTARTESEFHTSFQPIPGARANSACRELEGL